MALRDLAAFLEDDGLDYPVPAASFGNDADGNSRFPADRACTNADCEAKGQHVHYAVPSPDAKTGLWLAGLADIGARAARGDEVDAKALAKIRLDDNEERTLYQRVLGNAYDEMVADGVKWTALQRMGQDAYLCFALSQEVADVALGEAPARANRATRRATAKTAGRRSARASTGTATPTRRRASTGSSTSPSASGSNAATG